jgi:hypothetical protein
MRLKFKELVSECCNASLLYYISTVNGSIEYEQWDFCPECLECCSGYDPEERKENRISKLLKGANNDTITRAIKRLSEECGFGRKDNAIYSQNDSIYNGGIYATQECAP